MSGVILLENEYIGELTNSKKCGLRVKRARK